MKFNFRKIASVATSAIMLSSTAGLAAAASYPMPFVKDGNLDAAVVVGGSSAVAASDWVAAIDIANDLSGKASGGGSTTATTGGDSVKIDKSSTHWQLGKQLKAVITTDITDNSPGGGLPSLLKDGKFIDDDNDEFDFTQKVTLGDLNLTMFEDNDYKEDTPTVGVKINSGDSVLNYTLEFTDKPLWADLATSDIHLFGNDYYILSITNGTTLNLLDAAKTAILSEGESTSIDVDGTNYDVAIEFIGSSSVKLDINGKVTNSLAATETQKIAGGAYVGIKSIDVQDYAGGKKIVEFSIGKGKLKIKDGSNVEVNDDSVNGLTVALTTPADGNDNLQKVILEWKADEDLFLAPDSEVLMPGFEAVKLSMASFITPKSEVIEVKNGANDYWQLRNFPLKTSTETINFLYAKNSSSYTGIGKDYNNQLATTNNSVLVWEDRAHDYFVATFDDGSDAESYLMQVSNIKQETDGNKTTLQYKKDGVWTDVVTDAKNGDTATIGNVELTIGYIDKGQNNTVNLTAGTSVKFNRLASKEGLVVFLPYNDTDGGSDARDEVGGYIVTNTTDANLTYVLRMSEEDKNENPRSGANITLTLGFNSASTPEVSLTAIGTETAGGEGGRGASSSTEIGSTDVFRQFVYSATATEILYDKPSGGQNSVKLTYHGGESYAEIFLSDVLTTITPGSTGGEGGSITPIKDSEINSVSGKNLVVVGGSCINTVAAKILGSSTPLCSSDFTDATGVEAGQYIIKTVASPYAAADSGKVAMLVAGYNAADTVNAVAKAKTAVTDIDTEEVLPQLTA